MRETLALLEQDFTESWELTMARLCERSLSQQLRDEVCQVKRECRMALSEAMAKLKELQEDNGALRAQLASFKEDMKHRDNTKKKSPSAKVVLLMDSNRKHLDTRRMFPGRRVSSVRCANTEQALQLLKRDTLGTPSCIVIHTGTNDLRALQQHTARAVRKVAVRATQEFPDSRVVISTLLPRADTPPHIIASINRDHQRMCHPTQSTPDTPSSPGHLAPT
ncbi:hypothetical protein SKAU_G00152110 [Synaphobranchus kaupii]|uniref:Uncharacterized protein n=1 Tax=Synaphobranchus kaupii TaxID=118154 RepID=A0A9Q1FGZ1_SYNKA|nr:hypothetical protein SKAU_G00152110 [Synaphobranchus kaupii]